MSRPHVVQILGRDYLLPTWYPAPLVTGLALVDSGRRLFSQPVAPRQSPDLTHATIVVSKPDHFGDLIQATALFRALRDRLPQARVVLVHGSWATELAAWLMQHDYVHDTIIYDAAWLQSSSASWPARLKREADTRRDAAATIRQLNPAAFLDIRCTSPSTIDLAVAADVSFRVGFGLRGRSWEYHQLIPYNESDSLGQNWLNVLPVLGLEPATYRGPVLPRATTPRSADAPIIVQPGSRTASKEAPLPLWQSLLPALAERAPVMLVGNAHDRDRFAALTRMLPASRVQNAMGATSISDLIARTGDARAAVGVESMIAHLAIGHGVPTAVLHNPAASGLAAFPDALPTLTFVDMTADPQRAAALMLGHLDRYLS
jgi:ADP-heptose:LPS heptosyltransferase